jgi:hypothetical protein
MTSKPLTAVLVLGLLACPERSRGAVSASAQEPPWDPARVKACDRPCLTGMMDRYLGAMIKHDRAGLPLEPELRMTENAAQIAVGEGILWRARVEPMPFKLYVADPVAGQVGLQTVLNIEGRPALVAIRLKVERLRILEIEQLLDRNIAPQALDLLQAPRPQLVNDVPAAERTSREGLLWAAHSYFDALEGDSGNIAAFADDCVRHENGYQTVANKTPGRAAPSPNIPSTDTVMGRVFAKLSMMTCAQQVDTKIFSFMTKLRPRRVLILDEQKGLASAFPLFVQDGTRRYDGGYVGIPEAPKPTGLPMLINMTTMETFGIRGGKIHEVEVFPFVVLPYGYGNGWTPGAGR